MTPAETLARQREYEAEVLRLWAGQTDGAHDLGHLRRVWATARTIADTEGGADLQVLLAAAFFHDAVNLPKSHPDRARASALSAEAATRFLSAAGLDADRLAAIAHAIEAHSFSAGIPPRTPEARILQDADRLEALGAIGLARMFYVSGQLGRALFDPDDPLAEGRPLDDLRFALDHLETKLFRIAETMQTATGRAMAAERAVFMRDFRSQLLDEIAPS